MQTDQSPSREAAIEIFAKACDRAGWRDQAAQVRRGDIKHEDGSEVCIEAVMNALASHPATQPDADRAKAREVDLDRRRVVTLAKCGLMLSTMAGEGLCIDGHDNTEDLYADVLMSLAVEDAENPDIALEVARDDPEGNMLAFADTTRPQVSDERLRDLLLQIRSHVKDAFEGSLMAPQALDAIDDLVSAALRTQPSQAIPDGWVAIVPALEAQMCAVEAKAAETLWAGSSLLKGLTGYVRAMLAAAPTPPADGDA